jgi:hypothetical protein
MQDEIKSFEETRFDLNKQQPIFPQNIFKAENCILINREMLWPTTRNGKVVCQIIHSRCQIYTTIDQRLADFLKKLLTHHLEVPPLGYGQINKILSSQNPNKRQFEIIIKNFLACTYLDFVTMISNYLRQGKWVPCKHMYYFLEHVMFCGEFEIFIHFPT